MGGGISCVLTRAHSYAMSGQPVKKKLKRAVQVDVFDSTKKTKP